MQYPNTIRQVPHNAAGERYRGPHWLIKEIGNIFRTWGNLFRNAILTNSTLVGGELLFILCIALFPYYGDSSGAILGVRSVALLHGGIAEGIREVKETAILRIVLFNNYNNRIPMRRCDWILFLP